MASITSSFPYHFCALNSWMRGVSLCLVTRGAPENQARFKKLQDSICLVRLKGVKDTVPEMEVLFKFVQESSSNKIFYVQLQEIFQAAVLELQKSGCVISV